MTNSYETNVYNVVEQLIVGSRNVVVISVSAKSSQNFSVICHSTRDGAKKKLTHRAQLNLIKSSD